MVTGSGKDHDDHIQEPVHGHGQREGSNAAPVAPTSTELPSGAGSSPLAPPPAPPIDLPQEWVREQAKDGSHSTEGSSSAAAEVDRKGKKVATVPSSTPSSPSSAGSSGSTTLSYAVCEASGDGASSSRAVSHKGVTWKDPVVDGMPMSRKEVRGRFHYKNVFEQMLQEQAAFKEADRQWAVRVGKQHEEKVKSMQVKKTPWSKLKNYCKNKIFRRKGGHIHWEHVDHQTLPITEVVNHYVGRYCVASGPGVVPPNVRNLFDAYSEFRPVNGDGECFYRSFIFSYFEQVLNRQDTHEEQRLLAAVKRMAVQHAHLGWNSKFDRSHKAFKKLVNKVMKWKRQRRRGVASTNSYGKQKLLEFFSTYNTTEDIFVFLRLVVAIWICSHREDYEPLIIWDSGNHDLKDWCFRHVIPRTFADHVQMVAVATALEVPLRVEQLNEGPGQDIYTGTGVPLVRVFLLFTGIHYDIIYPRPPGESSSLQIQGDKHADESPRQQTLPD